MRCHSQYGYGLHIRDSIPLQNHDAFERLCFRHSEALSQAVYELMDRGRKIYPEEGLDAFQDVLDAIAAATAFSEPTFAAALAKNRLSDKADEYRSKLERFQVALERETEYGAEHCEARVSICGEQHPFSVSRKCIRLVNRKDKGFSIEGHDHIQLNTRLANSK